MCGRRRHHAHGGGPLVLLAALVVTGVRKMRNGEASAVSIPAYAGPAPQLPYGDYDMEKYRREQDALERGVVQEQPPAYDAEREMRREGSMEKESPLFEEKEGEEFVAVDGLRRSVPLGYGEEGEVRRIRRGSEYSI